jgi:GTP cyclohydrolase II
MQDLGHDTVNANLMLHLPADARTYEIACLILQDLGVDQVRLLTNNPEKIQGLTEGGMKIVETRSMVPMKWKALMEEAAASAAGESDSTRDGRQAKGSLQGKRVPSPPEGSSGLPEIKEMDGYLLTKIERMGHKLDVPLAVLEAATKKNGNSSAA